MASGSGGKHVSPYSDDRTGPRPQVGGPQGTTAKARSFSKRQNTSSMRAYPRFLQRVGTCGSNQRHITGGGQQFAGSSVSHHRLLERSGQAANCVRFRIDRKKRIAVTARRSIFSVHAQNHRTNGSLLNTQSNPRCLQRNFKRFSLRRWCSGPCKRAPESRFFLLVVCRSGRIFVSC